MTVRSLVVTHTFPWPARGGGAMRAAHTIESLTSLGLVDVACIVSDGGTEPRSVPRDPPVNRVAVFRWPPRTVQRWRRVPWLLAGRLPSMRIADYGAVRDRFRAWAGEYDLAWLGCGTEAFVALWPVLRTNMPVVANLDDIEDRKIEARRRADAAPCTDHREAGPRRWFGERVDQVVDATEIRRWRSLHRRMADAVDRVVVTSEVDAGALRALGISNVVVIPNVYAAPVSPAGRSIVGDPPTLSLVGTLHYPPNADAARFMVCRILPEIHRMVPRAQLRLVGRPDPGTAGLADVPGVVATGRVDDVTTELARADVIVVPIRYGSGTRIKILEGFAHRIPVVSTTIGAEGLDVAHGSQLLIADDPVQFAAACFDVLSDKTLRERLVNNAYAYWQREHPPELLRDRVTEIARELTA
jgi:glycosyltransferase involved in cell wall biosynthesis